ncbi:hypothetical protein [Niameybacter massiliensis]|uniref:hypothetical protein n=1 Tax=Niameybacter massiliensis TaxID=1658108 RepID=UPI0006B4675E|nr:hypothetical protein [Niameybacter massiliensis]
MINYYLTEDMNQQEILKRLKKNLEDDTVLNIGQNNKGETFVETDWYVYLIKLRNNRYTVPVMWSKSKKPYLIAGIFTVVFLLFFVGGLVTDISIVAILVGLGLVNVFKRREINNMKLAIEKALG